MGNVQPPQGRAARKSSATKGSKSKGNDSLSTFFKNAGDNLVDTFLNGDGPGLGHAHNSNTTLFNDPAPMYKPMLMPGAFGQAGSTAYVGKMFPDKAVSKSPYGFRFHYNPAQIHVSSQSDYNAVNAPSEGDGVNTFYNYGSMDFSILLNRQDEVMAGAKTAHRVMGSNNFSELGTMYDLEWMYRVYNSSADVNGALTDLRKSGLYESSISYILKAVATHVQFNNHLKYYGWPTAIDIQHQYFTAGMVPTITTVQITLAGLAPQPNNSSTTGTRGRNKKSGNGTKYRSAPTQNGHTTGPGV